MSDDTSLSRKLAALTAKDTFDGKALKLGDGGQPKSLSLVLQAIDDTMLLRNAVFSVGDSQVVLRVSGKRVQTVVSTSADLAPQADLIGAPLAADQADLLLQVAGLLERLTSMSGPLMLERLPIGASSEKFGSGVGIQTLNADWGVDQSAPKQRPMSAFLDACLPVAVALIALDNDVIEAVEGSDDAVDDLQSVLDEKWDQFERSHDRFFPADQAVQMRILDAIAPVGQSFLAAIIDEKQCFALVGTDAIAPLAAAWAAALD